MTDINFVQPPSSRMKVTLLFNRLNGAFVTAVSEPIDTFNYDKDKFVARGADFSFMDDYVDGGLILNKDGSFTDDFTIKPKSEKPREVYEYAINLRAINKITDKYPVSEQVNVLGRSIQVLAEKLGVGSGEGEPLEELGDMLDFIKECLRVNEVTKEHFANNPDVVYITDDELAAQQAATLEGNDHLENTFNPAAVGRVFKTDA